tara:strand:+ start:66 stop:626 length:561 start_codon:yes stop_codon:yes gene_type:complete
MSKKDKIKKTTKALSNLVKKSKDKLKDEIRKSNDAGAISIAKTASVPGALLYAATETPMDRKMGQISSEPIQTNPIKAVKTFIKMELEGKKIGDVSTREIFKYVEENPSYARQIYNRLVKGGEFNADELIKKINKKRKETGLKPYDFDKKGVEKKRDGGMVRKKKPVKKKAMKKSVKGTKWESKWG